MMSLMKLIHILSIVVWVGGMFFAYVVLRPAAVDVLQPAERLRLWDKVFSRFFNWVWLAIFLLLVSGLYMIYLLGGFARLPMYINIMFLMGVVMVMIYTYVFFKCYAGFTRLVSKSDWPAAGAVLGTIRKLIGLNLSIGLLTVVVALMAR